LLAGSEPGGWGASETAERREGVGPALCSRIASGCVLCLWESRNCLPLVYIMLCYVKAEPGGGGGLGLGFV
jgi:hypothetical protein